ncbi:MAG: siderophore-interacting protein [Actinomycetota bacterium]
MSPEINKSATDRASLLARLEGVSALDLVVTSSIQRTEHLQVVSFESSQLVGFEALPGQDLMVDVPTTHGQRVRRRYTIASLNAIAGTMEIWVALHGNGAGETWACEARAGDVIDGVGPRGKVHVNPEATHHLFIGDHSALAATVEMAASILSGSVSTMVSFPHEDDVIEPDFAPGVTSFSATALSPITPGDGSGLLQELAHRDLSAPGLHCYVNAEFGIVNAVKAALLERGVERDAISTKPYWRLGASNAPHGEPPKDDTLKG